MGTHADLLAAAGTLAAAARGAGEGGAELLPARDGVHGGVQAGPNPAKAAEYALAAKAALEAAALAESIGPGEIAEVLSQIQAELDAVGLFPEAMTLAPVDLLKLALEQVQGWQAEALAGRRLIEAYGSLRGTLERMERDFTAADTETSRRQAARIHIALEEAQNLVRADAEGDPGEATA